MIEPISPVPTFVSASPAFSERQAPATSQRRAGSRGRWWRRALSLILLLLVVVAIAMGVFYAQVVYFPRTVSGEMRQVTIAPGSSVETIAAQLEQDGILTHPLLFKLYLKLSGRGAHLQAGNFTLPTHAAIAQLADRLAIAQASQVKLRFLEGWRREEMAEYLTQHQQGLTGITGDQFSSLAKDPTPALAAILGPSLPAGDSLQGFLFPDTYQVSPTDSTEVLLGKMLHTYKTKVTPAMLTGFTSQGLTEYEAVTLASIVEREARAGAERPVIAGILLKRLKSGEPLGVDATVQYALGYSESEQRWWRQGLTVQDLALDSPYNTRRNAGLPPHPICNPSLEALQAVAQPATTPYLFYLHDAQGQIHYAQTLQEHNQNAARYLP